MPLVYDPVNTETLGSKELSSLDGDFSRLRQTALSDSSLVASSSNEKSAFGTAMESTRLSRGGHGGCGQREGGRSCQRTWSPQMHLLSL